MSPAARAGAALVAGLLAGIAVSASRSPALAALVSALEPVGTLWVNAIRMTVIPLVVSLLIAAVASVADARTIGRVGGRAFLLFVLLLTGIAVGASLVSPAIFERFTVDPVAAERLRATTGASAAELPPLPSFADWIVSLVPTNPIRAAADGAMLPLVVFSLAFALAASRIAADRRVALLAAFQGVADAMLVLVRWLLILAPLGVFALSLAVASRLGGAAVGAVAYYIAAHSALAIAAAAVLYLVVLFAGRTSIARFARASLPAQVVAMGSRSSMAALPAMIQGAERVLRLPREVTSFVLPLAVSTFRLNQAVSWPVSALFLAHLYGVELGATQLATLSAASVVMSFSVPGIPSGGIFIMAPFFASVGLPAEGIGLLIALDAIPDIFKTGLNVTGHMTAATVLARGTPRDDQRPERDSPRDRDVP